MIEDRELDSWREQWSGVAAEPSLELQRRIRRRAKEQDRRFVLGNLLTVILFAGILIFAVFVRQQASSLGTGWATGICVLVLVSAGYRLWFLRGTWRAETQSTRGFVELWQRRVLARLGLLRISIFVSISWMISCAALVAANWKTIEPNIKEWEEVLVASVLMQPVIGFWAAWLRRRKLVELDEVKKILGEIND